jgi:hypothetical protein
MLALAGLVFAATLGQAVATDPNANPLVPLAGLSRLYLPAGSDTLVPLPAQTIVLSPPASTFILASQQWQSKSVDETGAVDERNATALQDSSSFARVVCAGTSPPGQPASSLLTAQSPHLFSLTRNASLVVRAITFVNCGRVFRANDQSSLSLLQVRLEGAWRIATASELSSTRLLAVSIFNSTVRYVDALDAAANDRSSGRLEGIRCGAIALFCLLDQASLNARIVRADQVGLVGPEPPDRSEQINDLTAPPDLMTGSNPGRFAFTRELLAGSFFILRNNASASWDAVQISRARAEQGGLIAGNETSSFVCQRCVLQNNSAIYLGGVIALSGSSRATISQSSRGEWNQAKYGGFAWMQDASEIQMSSGSSFTNNLASVDGGGIALVLSARVSLNAASASGNQAGFTGGFVRAVDQTVLLVANSTSMIGNKASYGGAMQISTNATLNMTESFCNSNFASISGGCLYAWSSVRTWIRGGSFRFNVATEGGFVFADGGQMSLEGVMCDSNVAANALTGVNAMGGCLYGSYAALEVVNSFFVNNTALDQVPSDKINGFAGAIYAEYGVLNLSRCSFLRNTADYGGGALAIYSAILTVVDTSFVENVASYLAPPSPSEEIQSKGDQRLGYGGAILSLESKLLLVDTSFFSCSSDYLGGSLHLRGSVTLMTGGVIMCSNSSYGGGISLYPNAQEGLGDTLKMQGTKCIGNRARFGGCLYAGGKLIVELVDMEFSNNRAESTVNPHVTMITILLNPSSGGALVFISVPSAVVRNSTFVNNAAESAGGAVFVQASNFSALGVVARRNSANQGGFVISTGVGAYVFVTGLHCEANWVQPAISFRSSGGGCFSSANASSILVTNSSFVGNFAHGVYGFGGAFFDVGSSRVELRSLAFIDNISGYVAGAILLLSARDVIIHSCLFARNSAERFKTGIDVSVKDAGDSNGQSLVSVAIIDSSFKETQGGSIRFETGVWMQVFLAGCRWYDISGQVINIRWGAHVDILVKDSAFERIQGMVFLVPSGKQILARITNTTFSDITGKEQIVSADFEDNLGLIYVVDTSLQITDCLFQDVKMGLALTMIDTYGQGAITISKTSFERVQSKAVLHVADDVVANLSELTFAQSLVLDRGIVWIDSSRASVAIRNMSVANAVTRCGIVACVENAAMVTISDLFVIRSSCLEGDALLTFYSAGCAIVVSLAGSAVQLSVSRATIQGFPSWILFAVTARGGSIVAKDFEIRNFARGGILRISTADGFGSLNASNILVVNASLQESASVIRIEYSKVPTASRASFTGAIASSALENAGFAALIVNITVQNLLQLGGTGGILALAEGVKISNSNEASTNSSKYLRLLVSISNLRAANISTARGGACLWCAGSAWNVTIKGMDAYNVSATEILSRGGALLLSNGCSGALINSMSNIASAASGGFASIISGATLSLSNSRIVRSMALGALAGRSNVVISSPLSARRSLEEASLAESKQRLVEIRAGRDAATASTTLPASCKVSLGDLSRLQQEALVSSATFSDTSSEGWESGSGGAIFLDSSSRLRISTTSFERNFALSSGGVIFAKIPYDSGSISGLDPLQFSYANVTFARNSAMKGGVQHIQMDAPGPQGVVQTQTRLIAAAAASIAVSGLENCAKIGPGLSTSPASLQLSTEGGMVSITTVINLISGQTLPGINVTVLESLQQAFLDASFVSLILRTAPNSSAIVAGKTNALGSFGTALFPSDSIRVFGPPGRHAVIVASDDLFAQYPSTRLTSLFQLLILPCPSGSFVNSVSLSCDPCPMGTVSTAPESRRCSPLSAGEFSINGVTSRSCAEPDAETLSAAAAKTNATTATYLATATALDVKKRQCPTASVPVLAIALGTAIPLVVISIAGALGIVYFRRQLQDAQRLERPWLVAFKEIEWLQKIGEGSFGEVYRCKYRDTIVCVKRIKVDSKKEQRAKEQNLPDDHRPKETSVSVNSDVGLRGSQLAAIQTKKVQAINQKFPANVATQVNSVTRSTEMGSDHEMVAYELKAANEQLEEEIKIHLTLRHPNIVLFMGAVLEPENICLMTEVSFFSP